MAGFFYRVIFAHTKQPDMPVVQSITVPAEHRQAVQRFRWVAIAEGWSFLILLGIAMPLKYIWDWPLMVKYFGWAHGVLFVAYAAMALDVWGRLKQPFLWLVKAGFAALLPFGTFVFDRQFK